MLYKGLNLYRQQGPVVAYLRERIKLVGTSIEPYVTAVSSSGFSPKNMFPGSPGILVTSS